MSDPNPLEPTISSHLPDLVDQYISLRAQRLAFEKQAADVKETEEVLKNAIIAKFKEGDLKALGSKNGLVKMTTLIEPQAQDWLQTWEYIRETNQFDLLHKRLTNTAVKERWEAGIEIPGVGRQEVYKLTVSGTQRS
jgi:hypothetical protein